MVDDETLLDIVVDAVESNVQTVDVEQEVGLNDAVDNDGIVLGIDIDAEPIDPHVHLDTLQELTEVFV